MALAAPPGVTRVDVETALRDAGGLRGRAAGRRRGLRRRRGRLAAGRGVRGQDEEEPRGPADASRLVENPDILATLAAHGPRAAEAGGRLRRRDQRPGGPGAGQAASARAATGSSPTTSARTGSWAATRTRCCWSTAGHRALAARLEGRGRAPPGRAHRRGSGVSDAAADRREAPAARRRACRCRPTRPRTPPAWTCAPPCRRTSR